MTTNNQKKRMSPAAYLDPENNHFNLWWQATFFMVVLFVVTLLLWGLDSRELDGVSVWVKPLKFESSLALYFITLALLAGYLPAKTRLKASWRWATRFSVGAGVFEVIYILLQGARGRDSHYNTETPIEIAMYGLMGIGAVILVAVSFYLGWLLYRDYRSEKQDCFKLSAAYGLMLGSVLTLIIASTMSSGQNHFVGTPVADTLYVPILDWAFSGGDLRGPHFFATHLMQFLPLYGLWLQRQAVDVATAQQKIVRFSWVSCVVILGWFAVSFLL